MVGQDFGDRQAIVRLRGEGQPGVFTQQSQGASREVVAYAPLTEAGWGLVVSVPWSQVVQPVQYALTFIALALVLGLLGLTLIVFWAVNRINQPLERLVQQVRRVTAGDYDSQVSLSQIREIRALGLAFNYMVSQMKSYRSGLQEYVASVTDTQEEERKRIARDLHDGTVQSLIAIGQRIELSRDTLGEQPVELSKTQLTELRNMVTETIASVRQFSRDLRPLALEDLGLIPALQFLVNRLTQEEGMSAELQIEGEAAGLSPDLETTVYRLIQEALSNIRKHAQASEVLVTVRFLPRQTILEIQDNGVGFAVPQSTTDLARTGSFGLLGMEERAHLFGGDISIQSAINQGSIIRVILPHTQLPRRR
jgi:signal transduction histidine kinase